MNYAMRDIVGLVGGLLLIIFHRKLAQMTSDFYYSLLRIRFNEKIYGVGFLMVGIGWLVVAILSIFKLMGHK